MLNQVAKQRKTKLYAMSVNMRCGFVHIRLLHMHRTGNCICKLALVCVINEFL